jgi:hypothetical protein
MYASSEARSQRYDAHTLTHKPKLTVDDSLSDDRGLHRCPGSSNNSEEFQ